MANTILHKRSSTASAVPAAGSLTVGELAINTADGKLYTKKGDGTVVLLGPSTGSAPGAITPTVVTVDFGDTPLGSKLFTVSHLGATTSHTVVASVSGDIPSGSIDELEFEPLFVYGRVSAADTIEFMVVTRPGGLVSGLRKINYFVG